MSTTPFSHPFRARWVDMDFNQHMRNAAFLGCAEETRMLFMESHGWTMKDFESRQLGPVVLEDKLTYKKELRLLEAFRVDVQLAAGTEDLARIKVRNRFFRASDEALCATVDSVVLWFDLKSRKPIAPPDQLATCWRSVTRSEDFEAWTHHAK
jgi:acyl-CoA thioester hydrolase